MTEPTPPALRTDSRVLLAAALITGALVLVFWQVFVRLFDAWSNDGNYSHGFLIIPLAAYFAWERRAQFSSTPIQSSTFGLVVLIGSMGVLLAGLLSYLVQRSGLSLGLDRMLGSVFGLVRGAVIAGFAVMLGQAARLDSESWWKRSTLMPAGVEMAGILRSYVETGKQMVDAATEET